MGNLIQTFPQNDNSDCMKKGVDYVTAGQKSGTTLGANATAEGLDTTASSAQAHAEGKNTVASGSYSHAEGEGCTASGQNAHAEGWHTNAGSGCHAEGSGSNASSSYSHAEGVSTIASDEGAHAEGYASQATKKGSHSENRAYAQGEFSHAEGLFSKTKAAQAHAEGTGTLASSENQHVQGKYNVEDANGIYAHIVGNGTNSNNRSNIHTLDWLGNAWYAGDVNAGRSNGLTDDTKLPTGADVISYLDSNMSSSKTITGNPVVITDAANIEAEEVITNIEPIQDLHGYDYPWVGGAGKNKLRITLTSQTINGVQFTVNDDGTFLLNGTATTFAYVNIGKINVTGGTSYIISPTIGLSSDYYYRILEDDFGVWGSERTYEPSETKEVTLQFVFPRTAVLDNSLQKPMIRLATETDPTFAPYSNICPISGLDSVEVERTGKNQVYDVTYRSTKNQYAPVIKTSYKLKQGKRYVISFYTANTNIAIYRETPSVLGFDSLSEYAFDCDGTRKSMYGTATADATISNVDIIKRLSSTSDVENGLCYDLQIEEVADTVTTPTEYEPYQSETYTTSLPQITYGGTLNVQTGELVVDKRYDIIDGSKVTNVSVNSTTDTMGGKRLISTITDAKPTMGTVTPNIISDKLQVVTPDSIYSASTPNVMSINDIGQVVLRYQGASTLADAQTVLNNSPIQVAYELATPQTYQLTSHQVKLLLNYNNISTNANEISVKYQPNNNLGEILTVSEEYTDRKIKEEVKSSKDVSGNPIIIEDAANVYANEVIANISPVQDLHGYDKPWVGGAGKNILPLTVDGIKSVNTSATWTGNSITLSGVTFTIQTDSDDNVTGILANGDTTISSGDFVALNLPHTATLTGNYIINGCPAGGSDTTYLQRIGRTASSTYYATETGSGLSLNNVNDIFTVSIFVKHASNLVFKPMLRLATETDPTFEPYSNICPISGLDSVEVKRTGKNLLYVDAVSRTSSGITYTVKEDGRIYANGTSYSSPNYAWIHICSNNEFNKLQLIPGSTYILSGNIKPDKGLLYIEDTSNIHKYEDHGNGVSFTYNGETNLRVGYITNFSTSFDNEMVVEPMIRLASETDSTFEPYISETHTTSLPQTTYGGTLNVQTGELVVDRIYKTFNGSETWYTDSSRWANSYYTPWANNSKYTPSNIGFGNYIQCNKYYGVAKQVDNIQNGEILFNAAAIAYVNASIIIKDENYASLDDFKASLSSTPLQIVYELATPQTYHLTPEQVKLLKGYNHITTNADALDLTYQVDNVLGEILRESEGYTDRVFDGLTIYMKKGVDYVTAGKKANTTLGYKATAEGQNTTASGRIAHSEGATTMASGNYSHSEGLSTTASGQSAHAEGSLTEATASRAHAEGVGTKASSEDQHVEGKWNVEDSSDTYAHIIGGGTSDNARKNIFTVDWNGDVNAGRSNGLTNDTKLPTGADVISYLNSNIVNAGSNQINFSTTPQTYATSGSMWVQIIGKVCILSFVDLKISNNPTNNEALITSNVIPKSKYQVSSILIDSAGTGGAQKVMIGAGTNSICNYWTSDSFRKNGSFHGQLVYIIA